VDYSEKLTEIIRENNIKSVTVVRHGGALLRRAGTGGEKGTPAERESSFRGRWSPSRWTVGWWKNNKIIRKEESR